MQDRFAEKIAEMLDDIDELYEKVAEQNKKQKAILEQLNKVEQPYRAILTLRYIEGKTLVQVACEMGYSYERIKHKNGIALKKFEESTT